jgi:hypothetical protein
MTYEIATWIYWYSIWFTALTHLCAGILLAVVFAGWVAVTALRKIRLYTDISRSAVRGLRAGARRRAEISRASDEASGDQGLDPEGEEEEGGRRNGGRRAGEL